MEEKYIHIDVLFQYMQPELLLQNILHTQHSPQPIMAEERILPVNSRKISQECYLHCIHAHPLARLRSEDELKQRYWSLEDWMERSPRGGVFSLLAAYTGKVLRFEQGEPLCQQEFILEWRNRTLQLGQDLFTCAGLAAKDIREHRNTEYFSWPAAIRTDNLALWRLMNQGMAENHYHLNGSTQHFSLAWSYMMNFPHQAVRFFSNGNFQENYQESSSYGVRDNQMPWETRIYYAAWIRAYLFCKLHNKVFSNSIENFARFHCKIKSNSARNPLKMAINTLRLYAAQQPQSDGGHQLDYAITKRLQENNPGVNRLLAGEREFLYRCFCSCFDDKMENEDQDLLYLYLLIKMRFRQELIQSNQRVGFHNFSSYQDRKAIVWGDNNSYWSESYRLSIAAALSNTGSEHAKISSLELRIMPKRCYGDLKKSVQDIDRESEYHLENCQAFLPSQTQPHNRPDEIWSSSPSYRRYLNAQENGKYFYVIHFPKVQLKRTGNETKGYILPARNADVRNATENQAKVIANALRRNSYLCSRIRGIDACSFEIGCRPEVFATAFRYLRSFNATQQKFSWKPRYWPKLGATYHVGEDFLDIADGLRAIDEAICFLNLKQGDRLGHALALGIEPEEFYNVKNHCIFLYAQDLLDNLVWLLFRSQEWNVSIASGLRVMMQNRAEQLLHQIYGDSYEEVQGDTVNQYHITLLDYYDSWKLRGDDPCIYHSVKQSSAAFETSLLRCQNSYSAYERNRLDEQYWEMGPNEHHEGMDQWLCATMENTGRMHSDLRHHRKIQLLLYHYHFGKNERIKGQNSERFQIDPAYISLVRDMQNVMMNKIMQRGISIECNPSSNVLIGTFRKYENHPIFRFNNYGLDSLNRDQPHTQLQVSVNTDDLGVFDTLLENEYGILFGCLQLQRDSAGNPLFSSDSIYQYLDHLRKMGIYMVFPKSDKFAQNRFIN